LARGAKKGQQPHADRVVLAWSALLLLASAWLIPMDRARYILPMIAPAALVQALLIARVIALYGELRTAKSHD
jgi:ABC-type transport system involved in cytochrome bd biosynthesis fused ATPase/permease subunit